MVIRYNNEGQKSTKRNSGDRRGARSPSQRTWKSARSRSQSEASSFKRYNGARCPSNAQWCRTSDFVVFHWRPTWGIRPSPQRHPTAEEGMTSEDGQAPELAGFPVAERRSERYTGATGWPQSGSTMVGGALGRPSHSSEHFATGTTMAGSFWGWAP